MITVENAIHTIRKVTKQNLKSEEISLEQSNGYVLFEDVISSINMPPFRQSAMDGYAICLHEDPIYTVLEEIKAGDNINTPLKKGQAVRIYTGAPVPDSANAVIMQERTLLKDGTLFLTGNVKENDNIRPLGEQVQNGEIALQKGTQLNAASIGFLATIGVSKVKVYTSPNVCILSTGNELVQPGTPLKHGQIYESNSIMLKTALQSNSVNDVSIHQVKDDYESTKKLLQHCIENNDVVIVSGGISVGDYDFVGKALLELKVEEQFYKVQQKPGKPLFFGTKENTLIFALPGNPAAALTCFYIYANPSIQQFKGLQQFEQTHFSAKSKSSFTKKGNRAQFLKAHYSNGKVEILEGQSSAMLQTFALANALVFMHQDAKSIEVDDVVPVIMLPQ